MIDLHAHILPGIDDGSPDLETSLAMAAIAQADGITHMACTPHIVPGVYNNSGPDILAAVVMLQQQIDHAGLELKLFPGADVHIAPNLVEGFGSGQVPTLNWSRYFLFEPTHHILPPRIEELAKRLLDAGYVPIITHPERLTWIASHYDVIERLNDIGCLIQLTADSILGKFGKTAQYYSDKLLDEGRVDIIATDAHGTTRRAPHLSAARDRIAERLGEQEATAMVRGRPAAIVSNRALRPVASKRRSSRSEGSTGSKSIGRLFKGRQGR